MTIAVSVADDASEAVAPILGLAIMPTPAATDQNYHATTLAIPNGREITRLKSLLSEQALEHTKHQQYDDGIVRCETEIQLKWSVDWLC